MEEMRALAAEVEVARKVRHLESKKRKRLSNTEEAPRRNHSFTKLSSEDPVSPKTIKTENHITPADTPHIASPTNELTLRDAESYSPNVGAKGQLEGLQVVIIHVKDKLSDGPDVGDTILGELLEYEREAQLGCEFIISKPGQSFYL